MVREWQYLSLNTLQLVYFTESQNYFSGILHCCLTIMSKHNVPIKSCPEHHITTFRRIKRCLNILHIPQYSFPLCWIQYLWRNRVSCWSYSKYVIYLNIVSSSVVQVSAWWSHTKVFSTGLRCSFLTTNDLPKCTPEFPWDTVVYYWLNTAVGVCNNLPQYT